MVPDMNATHPLYNQPRGSQKQKTVGQGDQIAKYWAKKRHYSKIPREKG
jgi:hypothetical protein